jgi:hypothetical protein
MSTAFFLPVCPPTTQAELCSGVLRLVLSPDPARDRAAFWWDVGLKHQGWGERGHVEISYREALGLWWVRQGETHRSVSEGSVPGGPGENRENVAWPKRG